MILTVTPNPSIDLLFTADRLVWDDANRLDSPRRRAGGQGINLARAVRALGGDARAVALLGGTTGEELARMLAAEGIDLDVVPIAGKTRVFVGVRESTTGRSLLLNARGPKLDAADGDRLLRAIDAACSVRPRWIVCSGSLPPGLPPDIYARVLAAVRRHRAAYVVDCDGEPLRLAASAGCEVLSPNAAEAERLIEAGAGSLRDERDAVAAAREMRSRFGARVVFVTLGAAGAVGADAGGAWHAPPPEPDAAADASTVGAGDAFLAAALLALGSTEDVRAAVRAGVAAGSAALRSAGGDLIARAAYDDMLQMTNARRIV